MAMASLVLKRWCVCVCGQGNYRLTLTLVHTPAAAGGAVPAWAGEGSVAIRSTVLFSVVEESATQIESMYEWQSVEAWQTVEGGASSLVVSRLASLHSYRQILSPPLI